ncbi:SUMO1 activating enzyme subunit 1 [Lycorma delicatula]|uniref:SUMO1 activating enzyme subunit 1 n=1 Tax=Lycorma delicatula TaxID=130591 RepID=UPI003F511F51
MVKDGGMELTEDEAQLYDRQIRLWGLESQKRLRCAKVLIIGLQGLGAEVCKNVILAGVKAVTVLDDENVTEEDICAQFLAPRNTVGKNRAISSLERAQALNPLVDVKAESENVANKPDNFFTQWDVIVATNCPLKQLLRLNGICRSAGVKFFCGDVFGFFGYFFVDLQIHEYSEEVTKHVSAPVRAENKKQKIEEIKVTQKNTATFVPFQDAIDIDWTSDRYKSKVSKLDFSYFLMKILLRFRSENHRNPKPGTGSDVEQLKNIRDSELAKLEVPLDKVGDSVFDLIFAQVSPVCAIVGGVLAQEVIKAVSQKEAPHNNMFFFNPTNNLGQIFCLGN